MPLDDAFALPSADLPVADRLALLEAMTTRVPAPEFLWYDMAVEALAGDDVRLKPAAIALLAQAPRSWHQVLVAGLTEETRMLQSAAIKTLFAHALGDASRRPAFVELGQLPGWSVEARALWKVLAERLPVASAVAAEPAPLVVEWPVRPVMPEGLPELIATPEETLAEARHEIASLEERVVDLEDENFRLREDRVRLGSAYEQERARSKDLMLDLEAARLRNEALQADLLTQLDAVKAEHERGERRHRLTTSGLEEALDNARARQRKLVVGGLMALTVLGGLGGPILYSIASRSAVMAASPDELHDDKPVPGPENTEATATLAGATDMGYRRAYSRIMGEATALAGEGRLTQSLATWQVAIRLAPTPTDALPAEHAAQLLEAKINGLHAAHKAPVQLGAFPVKPHQPAAPKPQAPKPHVSVAHATVHPKPKSHKPSTAAHGDGIPASIRAKF